ncbi:MAG: ParB/RepB/Spo0J family partition protein [Deltaproteobacteria bacterium]|nr:ParB/RepB/Spo0J family partition protein [Deltaproteobacteria bacterium]
MEAEPAQVRLIAAGSLTRGRRTLVTALPLDHIRPNPDQPRRHFDEQSLTELCESIRERGLLQPVIVRREPDGGYLLLAGERRYRASRMAGLTAIPALVRDDHPLEIAMIENLQREDLTPLEEARGIAGLIEAQGYTHAEVADLLHKSRPHVSNTLALTRLPKAVQDEYNAEPTVSRDILISVARQKDEQAMLALWRRAKLERLSVKSFREELAPRTDGDPAVRRAINSARRLGRRLAALPEQLPEEARGRLQRTLRRLRRKIERFLGERSA